MRIAMLGLRGLPATYGGIERHVEEIGSRLAAFGHEVTVYGRRPYSAGNDASYKGITLRNVGAIDSKHFEAASHTLWATADALRLKYDVLHFHGVGPAVAATLPRLFGRPGVVATLHGMDFEREKWSRPARLLFRSVAGAGIKSPRELIVVSSDLQARVLRDFGRHSSYIPNGISRNEHHPAAEMTRRMDLRAGRYFLSVGRLVPEKGHDVLVRAFLDAAPPDWALVIAGDSSFTDSYVSKLKKLAGTSGRVRFPGFVYGDDLAELYSNAGLFVQPSRLEGMPLTLLEARSYGLPVIASDLAVHKQVLGPPTSGARFFQVGSTYGLAESMRIVLASLLDEQRAARKQVTELLRSFSWDAAAARTEEVYTSALTSRP